MKDEKREGYWWRWISKKNYPDRRGEFCRIRNRMGFYEITAEFTDGFTVQTNYKSVIRAIDPGLAAFGGTP